MRYKDELVFLQRTEKANETQNKRYIISKSERQKLQVNYPNISTEYLDYLQEIGAGSFRECQFKVFETLFSLADLGFSEAYNIPHNIKFFGDNFSGDFAGFDLSTEQHDVIEFWHDSEELYYTQKKFQEYIREQMLMDESGNDLRE